MQTPCPCGRSYRRGKDEPAACARRGPLIQKLLYRRSPGVRWLRSSSDMANEVRERIRRELDAAAASVPSSIRRPCTPASARGY